MKRSFPTLMAAVLVAGLTASGFGASADARKGSVPPATEKASVTATAAAAKPRIPGGTSIIIKGVVGTERDNRTQVNELVVRTETGETYLPINAAFANTLRFNAMGKTVTLKGKHINNTSFKGYPAIHVMDILEIK